MIISDHLFNVDVSLLICILFLQTIVMITVASRLAFRKIFFAFSEAKITSSRVSLVRNCPLTEQPQNLSPVASQHLPNSRKIISSPFRLRFLVQQGGFPGCSDLGFLFRAGTQVETPQTSGSLFCLKNLVHMKPQFKDSIKNYQFLSLTGATVDFNYDVESSYLKCSFFEEDTDIMVDLMLDLALREKKLFQQQFSNEEQIADIGQLMRIAAYPNQGYARPTNGAKGEVLTNKAFIDFQRKFITPHGSIISLSNLQNPQKVIKSITDKIQQRYPSFLSRPQPIIAPSKYIGSTLRVPTEQPIFDFAVGFQAASSKSPNMEMYNIIRILLGSASSFSSGGPGKGMHSRCTRNMLNREACIESASFILSHYDHSGLFGLTASGPSDSSRQIIQIVLREINLLRDIPQIELQKAKNMLIASIYTNIERQSDRLQETTKHVTVFLKQINNYDRIKLEQFEPNIRKVTTRDIKTEIERLLKQSQPSFVVRGDSSCISVGRQMDWKKRLVQNL